MAGLFVQYLILTESGLKALDRNPDETVLRRFLCRW